jgi:polyferredoxin
MLIVLLVLSGIAGLMAGTTAILVKWAAQARTTLRAGIVLFLLEMMAAMFGGAVLYFTAPTQNSLIAGLWLASGLMSLSVLPLFYIYLKESAARLADGDTFVARPLQRIRWFVASVIGLVLLNEFLMGWTFQLASGQTMAALLGGGAGTWNLVVNVVDSPWFLFTMSAEMVLTTVFLRDRMPRPVIAILLSQAVIMLFSPPALGWAGWTALSIYVSSAAMIGLFVYLMEYLYRHNQLAAGFSNYLLELLAVYGLMMAGLFLWLYYGNATLFALSIALEMVVYFGLVVYPEVLSGPLDQPWQLRPHWAFGVLSLIFVAEFFMGAVLDVQINPATYLGGFPFLALSGSASTILINAVSNGFWFLATVCASTWFLTMMGIEMGALVAFKFRETRNLENRIRLLLMMGAYAGFAVFYPSLYFGLLFPNAPDPSVVPVLGWSMGIGSYPLAIGLFSTVLLTYVIVGGLVVLFGRRVVCSVFCTAPLMYQGTTIDSMKTFNRSSPIARKYLSSRFKALYSTTTGVVMGSLVATSVLSYLDTTGAVNFFIQGTDPSVFLFTLYFSVLWYLMFVTIPYTGTFNCVTMGWCYTGAIAQAFQKIGMFKLKVRDKQVCRDCTTLDCAKGCPIGLVDMPGHFRTKGEFRSTKCCGVGECVESCPYDNLYISDVRHWIRRRLGRPDTRPRRIGSPVVSAHRAVARAGLAPALMRSADSEEFTILPVIPNSPSARRTPPAVGPTPVAPASSVSSGV